MEDAVDPRPIVEGKRIDLDYNTLKDTIYLRCLLVYEGGRPPKMVGCDFRECEFAFEGKALNTQLFMGAMANAGPGGAKMVIQEFLGIQGWEPKDG